MVPEGIWSGSGQGIGLHDAVHRQEGTTQEVIRFRPERKGGAHGLLWFDVFSFFSGVALAADHTRERVAGGNGGRRLKAAATREVIQLLGVQPDDRLLIQ